MLAGGHVSKNVVPNACFYFWDVILFLGRDSIFGQRFYFLVAFLFFVAFVGVCFYS